MLVLQLFSGLSCMHGSVLARLWEEGSHLPATTSDQIIPIRGEIKLAIWGPRFFCSQFMASVYMRNFVFPRKIVFEAARSARQSISLPK